MGCIDSKPQVRQPNYQQYAQPGLVTGVPSGFQAPQAQPLYGSPAAQAHTGGGLAAAAGAANGGHCGGLVARLRETGVEKMGDQVGSSTASDPAQVRLALQAKLIQIITGNSLQAFYPPQRLEQVLDQLARTDFRGLASKWRIPVELAYDLATLALYDIVLFCDDSGSMQFEDQGSRIEDLRFILSRVSDVAVMFDSDGLSVRFMNSSMVADNVTTSEAASQLLNRIQFQGSTPLGTNLYHKVVKPFVEAGVRSGTLQKPVLVVTITDGEPSGEPVGTVFNTIRAARQLVISSPYGQKAIAFQFAQVGRDMRAQKFLAELDNHPEIGAAVDVTSYYELEAEECKQKGITLTPELWLLKLMVGAVDPFYDAHD